MEPGARGAGQHAARSRRGHPQWGVPTTESAVRVSSDLPAPRRRERPTREQHRPADQPRRGDTRRSVGFLGRPRAAWASVRCFAGRGTLSTRHEPDKPAGVRESRTTLLARRRRRRPIPSRRPARDPVGTPHCGCPRPDCAARCLESAAGWETDAGVCRGAIGAPGVQARTTPPFRDAAADSSRAARAVRGASGCPPRRPR